MALDLGLVIGSTGPTGETGATGATGATGTSFVIKNSYDTLAELQAAHPTGSAGDVYVIGTDLYVWTENEAWESIGPLLMLTLSFSVNDAGHLIVNTTDS